MHLQRPVIFTLELGVGQLRLDDVEVHSQTTHFDNRYAVDLGNLDQQVSFTVRPRLTIFLSRHVYIGAQVSLGVSGAGVSADLGELDVRLKAVFHVGAEAVVGVAIPLGGWQVSAEVLGGRRALMATVETQHGACINQETHSFGQWTVAGRVGVEVFRSSILSIGAYGGYDPIQREAQGGLRISGHTRSFDAQHRR